MPGFDGTASAFRAFNNYFLRRLSGAGGGGTDCDNVSASAGTDQAQLHCSQISVTGSRSGGSGFTYLWKLYDPEGNDVSSRLTGSTSLSCSYIPFNDIGGSYTQVIRVENSGGSVRHATSHAEIGDNGWIRLRPDDCTYVTGSGYNATQTWSDNGTITGITMSVGDGTTRKPSNSSIQGIQIEGYTWFDVDDVEVDIRFNSDVCPDVAPVAQKFYIGFTLGKDNVIASYGGFSGVITVGSTSETIQAAISEDDDTWSAGGSGTGKDAWRCLTNMNRVVADFGQWVNHRYRIDGSSIAVGGRGAASNALATTDPVHLNMLVFRESGGSEATDITNFQLRYRFQKRKGFTR